ncbi:hypothetical protein DYB32_000934 [Aphanomyces invadans]|uniref:Uncharacterized protein n=1 Tax=Aphanomyces invadans TaxID=157072 RepID=A0A418B8D6_9STRA|nr:hypothetical protein DYB32_000934 [Aphanomyces invadans]
MSPAPTTSSEDDCDSDDGGMPALPFTTRVARSTQRSLGDAIKALAAEKALTERCAVRISQLNDMIKFQRTAHEKLEREKLAVDRRLAETEDKLLVVQGIADQLQSDVAALKRHDGSNDSNMNLLQFSTRLSKVIEETKQVVAMKDQYIAQLEQKVRYAAILASQKTSEVESTIQRKMATQLEAATTQVLELQAECDATRAKLADRVGEVAMLTSRVEATAKSTATWMEETEAQHRRVVLALEEKVAAQSQLLHQFKEQCENHDVIVDADTKRWQAAIDAITVQLHDERADKQQQVESANQRAMESELLWKEQLEALETQHKAAFERVAKDAATWQQESRDAIQAKDIAQGHLNASRLEAAQLRQEVDNLRAQVHTTQARLDEMQWQLDHQTTAVDKTTQQSDPPPSTSTNNDKDATDTMIQSLIAEVEQARRREAHLTHVLSLANRHEHEANVRLGQIQNELQSRRKENIELAWAIGKRDHALRMLEQRHAFVAQCTSADTSRPTLSL